MVVYADSRGRRLVLEDGVGLVVKAGAGLAEIGREI